MKCNVEVLCCGERLEMKVGPPDQWRQGACAAIGSCGVDLDGEAEACQFGPMTSTPPTILVVDDARTFDFPAVYARTAAAAIALLRRHDARYDEVWLDHDLGEESDVRPVVELLERRAFRGRPIPIGHIFVQSDDPPGAAWIVAGLTRWYEVSRVATRTPR